jgi:dTDP-4-amino-4,6-dideoxygalactose transaminase
MKIPFFDLKRQSQKDAKNLQRVLNKVLKSGHFILGENVRALEDKMAQFCGTKFAVALASGSDALWLALQALEIGPGDDVITTPYTFVATATSILKAGARPVFADIDSNTFQIDPEKVRQAVTAKTKALIPVHLFGLCAPMKELKTLAKAKKIKLVEDAAQSLGASFEGNPAGSMGDAGTLSFYPTKNLGAAGDAGMVVTQDQNLAEKIRILRGHGATQKYFHEYAGWNSRLDEIQAAILLVKYSQLKKRLAARVRIAKRYFKGLEGLPVYLPHAPENAPHTFNQFVICTEKRDDLKTFLQSRGVGTEVYYPLALHLQPCFSYLGYRKGDFPNSEKACRESLALPVFPELTLPEIDYVIRSIQAFFKQGA